MRLDHIAFRVPDRRMTADFFVNCFGYRVQKEFTVDFDTGPSVKCIALEPPEKLVNHSLLPWSYHLQMADWDLNGEYHLPPEVFVSDGPPGSVVGDWVAAKGGLGCIHHIAYQVESVDEAMARFRGLGVAFSTDEPVRCPEDNLVQVFTKPLDALGGIVIEFIERGEHGFCGANVKRLMESSK